MNFGIKAKFKQIFWILFSIAVGIFFTFYAIKIINQKFKIPTTKLEQIANPQNSAPEAFYFIKNPEKKPSIKAEAYFVGDLDTGEIILQKNSDKKFPIASVTKLFTATTSVENQKQDEITKVSPKALSTEGENGNFYTNEKIKVSDLLYPLLLESSNDAAEIIAEDSGRTSFIEKMNETVKDLGLASTFFADPSGLSEKNQSTAKDLFKFAQYLKTEKQNILQITTRRSYNNKTHVWFNTSQFLNFQGYVGGKRGYTDESMQTALSVFSIPLGESGSQNIGIIVLRSPDRLKDVQNIYNYLKKNVYYGKESDANLAWVKQKEGVIEEQEPNFVTLAFGGDLMLDRGVKNSVMKNFDGDYSALFENLDILKKVDIAFANLEGPASDKGKDAHNLYSFRMNPSIIPALKGAGFSILSTANNHEGDWGRDAYADTLARLKENEILYTGGNINSTEAENPTIIEKYGMKIGYLGFTDTGPDWMKATENQAGILSASNPHFAEIIKNASAKVDFLIVSFHFGEEYQKKHNQRQENLAHTAIDNGAKIIIGSHPHVVQDTEVYKNGFIAYSLGNLIFDQYFSPDTMGGMLLEIKLWKDGGMTINKDTVNLSKAFQPETLIKGKDEKIKFQETKTQ
jgi:D-alanyl-D-alanine carboxypeptidase